MVRLIVWAATGVLALAAFSLSAAAEPSVISFVSGPLAGVAAEDVKHEEDNNLAERGTQVTESASFFGAGTVAWVQWSRLSGNYVWQDTGLGGLTDDLRDIFKATGATVITGDRTDVGGFNGQFRIVDLTGVSRRCGVFQLRRLRDSIIGFMCRQGGQTVPVVAILQGLSVKGVISGP
jgi:hypothetical protein